MATDGSVTDLGQAGGTADPADLVQLPQPPAGDRRGQDVWPKLADHLDGTGMTLMG
jgi:hypothetical protein